MKLVFEVAKRTVRGFLDHNGALHAAGLTYYSLLAVIPILCCILVLAKACRVDSYARDQLNGKLDAMIANLERGQDDGLAVLAAGNPEERAVRRKVAIEFGQQARTVSQQLFSRIEEFNVSTFGWIGFGLLLWTVISTLSSVEASFNRIRGVPRGRPVWKCVYVYPLILVVLPVLVAIAMSLPVLGVVKRIIVATAGATSVTKWLSDGLVWLLDSGFFSFAIVLVFTSLTFTFLFWFLPNERVPLKDSLYGGLFTAILFGCWWKICAVAQVGIAKSSALYGSFAFLPIILAWLYISWQIILLGACFVKSLEDCGRMDVSETSEPKEGGK